MRQLLDILYAVTLVAANLLLARLAQVGYAHAAGLPQLDSWYWYPPVLVAAYLVTAALVDYGSSLSYLRLGGMALGLAPAAALCLPVVAAWAGPGYPGYEYRAWGLAFLIPPALWEVRALLVGGSRRGGPRAKA